MAKGKPELTHEAVNAAIESAKNGKGGPLAKLIKSCSISDLTRAFTVAGPMYHGHYDEDLFMHGLKTALVVVEGRRKARVEFSQWKKEFRKKQPTQAETTNG